MLAQRVTRVGAALAAMMIATPAASLTGAELYRFCLQPKGSDADLFCAAYLRGFTDGLFLGDATASDGKKLCTNGKGIDLTQARLLIRKHLQETPAFLDKEAGYLAAIALYERFGCKTPN